jgi:hypothetical protein
VDHGAPRLHPGPNENLEATQPDRISMYGMAESQAKCDNEKRQGVTSIDHNTKQNITSTINNTSHS